MSGSGKHPGRPRVSRDLRILIRRMAKENAWSAPRIHAELVKLGIDISEVTVSRYMPKRPPNPDKVARWKAFLGNHMPEIAAMDFVTIPTATFQLLHCLSYAKTRSGAEGGRILASDGRIYRINFLGKRIIR